MQQDKGDGEGMVDGAEKAAKRIADVAAECGISLVASLPDGWITTLITQFANDARFRHVAVNREESAIGLCSGAFFSGTGAFALMGASGFLTCIYAITKINYTYQIPILIGITLRGRPGDNAKFQCRDAALIELSHHCTKATTWVLAMVPGAQPAVLM